MSSLWQPRCPGSCSVGDSLGSGCGFVVLGSYFLYSFLCSSLGLVPCSYLFSLGLGCCSFIGAHLSSFIVARFFSVCVCYLRGRLVVRLYRFPRFYFLKSC